MNEKSMEERLSELEKQVKDISRRIAFNNEKHREISNVYFKYFHGLKASPMSFEQENREALEEAVAKLSQDNLVDVVMSDGTKFVGTPSEVKEFLETKLSEAPPKNNKEN